MTTADRISVERGDITKIPVDVIVNAANSSLSGGGGVDGAIHRAAGPQLLEESRRLAPCPTGSAVVTKAYRLPAEWVIHAVGPVWEGGQAAEDELLASCYATAMRLADERGARSISFPAISCGVYGFPIERASRIAARAVAQALGEAKSVQRVLLVAWSARVERALTGALEELRDGV